MIPPTADPAASLLRGAVDALPAGRLAKQLAEGRQLRIKLGIDPTAPDIHLGHVVILNKLADFQRAGHQVVLIMGDYTARIGDPSGRSALRPVLGPAQIDANARTFTDQAFKVLDRDRTEIRFNSEWLDMPVEDLFNLARRFTVARLLERDDFAKRMAASQPISALEILYPVLQGYDSVAVRADVELGGTDQTFNLLFGRDVQESYGMAGQSILTMPILPGLDGVRKMSKSLGNYVGVTDDAGDMFGKLMSIPDTIMPMYYELLLGEDFEAGMHPNRAKRSLARKIIDRFHPAGESAAAESAFDRLHVRHELPGEVPEYTLGGDAGSDIHLPAAISAAFAMSSSEARRLLKQGGVKLDGEVLGADRLDLARESLAGRVLQVGKRRFVKLL